MQEITKILKAALFNEVKSGTFYTKAAEITDENDSRMLFLELSGKEDDHARLIVKKLEGTPYAKEFDLEAYLNYLESTNESPFSAEESKTLKSCDIKKVLDLAIGQEKKALEIYLNLEKKAVDPELKSLCHELVQEEKGHLNSVTTMRLSLNISEEERPAL